MGADTGCKKDPSFDELEKAIEGDILCDEMSRALYSSGACLYRIKPLGIVRPRNRADVARALEYAGKEGIPVTARGGGTSRTGNELGEGIILDFSRYMNGILEFNGEEKWVRVQPGVILSSLNAFLKPHGLFFPIDPSTKEFCTLGGMIANNSSGPHAVEYGTTRDHVLSLDVVLAGGETLTTGPSPPKETTDLPGTSENLEAMVYRAMPEILDRYGAAMAAERPHTTKDSSGYHLWRLKDGGTAGLTSLFVGSEGTLGIVTEAMLRLTPIPTAALSGLLYFDTLANVGEATQRILELSPSMVEIMERHILDLAREQKEEMRPYLPDGVEALLYIEFQGGDTAELRRKFEEVGKRAVREGGLAVDLKIAENEGDMDMFSKVRSVSGPILNNIKGPVKPVAFIEDAAVHPSRLPEYIAGLRERFDRYGVSAGIYGHAGDGNLHTMVFLDLGQQDQVDRMGPLAEDVYDLVLDLKGTISGEHGDGRTRTGFLRKQYPKLYPAFAEIKALFDPRNILNPGIIVGGAENALDQHLKHGTDYRSVQTDSPFDGASLRAEIDACSGCGKCRSYCPIAQQIPEEWAMGRGKIILLREILTGELDPEILQSPAFKDAVDACINCKRCLKECPSGVDVPWLSVIGRANYLKAHGEPLSSRLLTRTRFVSETGSALAPLANLAGALAPVRRLMEKAVGLDRRRDLPAFQRRTLSKIRKGRPRPDGGREIVLFPGCYASFHDPEGDGVATLSALEANGFDVLLPDLRCCGIARISAGARDGVMDDIRFNVEEMVSYVERGLDIVFCEPSCLLAVKMEYPKILGTEASRKVAEKCYDIHQYLTMRHRAGELDLRLGALNLTVGYHHPCHLRALIPAGDVVELLECIPGVRVREFSDGCCGLGGTFGMKKENFDLSMDIGSRLFGEIDGSDADEIATGCGACAMQILQGTRRRAVHPISLLARAYKERE